MDSPINVGDTTTNSILHRLQDTHINSVASASISAASYSGQQVIQLDIAFKNDDPSATPDDSSATITIVRRVQDSYININQLFQILIKLEIFTKFQVEKFLSHEVLNNPQYIRGFDDFRNHDNPALCGIWIPYDKAVSLSIKFDIYEFVKKLFLVDVHDYDKLPKAITSGKRTMYDSTSFDGEDASLMGSPTKKQKRSITNKSNDENETKKVNNSNSNNNNIGDRSNNKQDGIVGKFDNPNAPFTLPPQNITDNPALVSEIKLKYSEIFKKDDATPLTFEDVKEHFAPITSKYTSQGQYFTDLPLDQQGKTALHFASTLASLSLVSSFIKLGLCSPIRGTSVTGESPLILTITVTNSMEKGNFRELLSDWLYPSIWLLDKNKWTIFHHLASQSTKKLESTKYYLLQILEWIMSGENTAQKLNKLVLLIINLQDETNGNTCLHLAAENECKWLINILIELNANVNISNKTDLKPVDYDIVKEVIKERDSDTVKYESEQENYVIELLRSNLEILKNKVELGITEEEDIDLDEVVSKEIKTEGSNSSSSSSSSKIFQSIQNLLFSTNKEYETLINQKKQHLNKLNEKVHDISIVTANNRFISKKITEKIIHLENIKLQMGNITDKLEFSRREIPDGITIDEDEEGENTKYDADEPFRIAQIYEQLLQNGGDAEKVEFDETLVEELPSLSILNARLKAYEKINSNIENEISSLSDYSELTSKFKKVVSFCTGVDINEVDELLDGLIDAVEGQQ